MKTFRVFLGLCLASCLGAWPAQAGLIVNFDENGNGTVSNGIQTFTLTSFGNTMVDPVSGLKPLSYDLTGNPLVGLIATPGDIELFEPGVPPTDPTYIQELLRFSPQGILFVYSEIGEADKADIGIPPAPNALLFPEMGPENGPNGLFGYSPAAGTPGSLPVAGGVIYNFTSDAAVPEPATFVMLGSGLMLAAAARRMPRRRAKAA